jgi:hypothetical protein
MWPFKKKPSGVHFQIVKPAGEVYYVIRKREGSQWVYLYQFSGAYITLANGEFSWHATKPQGATKYVKPSEAYEVLKRFSEFDEIVADIKN